MQTISVDILRAWLEERRKVVVLDVRPRAERAEWAIPGSIHMDVYEALKAHDLAALAHFSPPAGMPVVTICGAGKVSQIAAEQLAAREIPVWSLEGGMKAWSLAWNIAHVPVQDQAVQVIQVRRTGKGCLSYLIGDGEKATVIDASLDPQAYLDLAQQRRWQIISVLDTHIHADHLSRSRQLAEQSGAMLFLPDQERVLFPFTAIGDGNTLDIGKMQLAAIHTPGHTGESTCYLLNNQVLFTGDTLFPTGVGRPDLASSAIDLRLRTETLYQSLHKLLAWPGETLVLAGHTSVPVPFDGMPIVTTLAEINEKVSLLHATRTDFVRVLLDRLPATPPNYDRIVALNERGLLPEVPVTELEAGANRCAVS
jgi:glyoxylase-like metal-dependent hydrolase (beta-lactamase superfamily II)/rhodanese-related sulfurtransferase